MSLRDTLEEHRKYVLIGVGVVFLISLILMTQTLFGGGGGEPVRTFENIVYYDLASQTIIVKPYDHDMRDDLQSPLPDRPQAYIAGVFACGSCPEGVLEDGMTLAELDAAGMFVAYIKQIDSTGRRDQWGGRLVQYRAPNGNRWYDIDTDQAFALVTLPFERCPDAIACAAE